MSFKDYNKNLHLHRQCCHKHERSSNDEAMKYIAKAILMVALTKLVAKKRHHHPHPEFDRHMDHCCCHHHDHHECHCHHCEEKRELRKLIRKTIRILVVILIFKMMKEMDKKEVK